MKIKVVNIGNSRGIRIPKPLLETSGLGAEVELEVTRGEIRITPAKPNNKKTIKLSETYIMSLGTLNDWNRQEEDKAWAQLQ